MIFNVEKEGKWHTRVFFKNLLCGVLSGIFLHISSMNVKFLRMQRPDDMLVYHLFDKTTCMQSLI